MLLHWITDAQIWASLLTLTVLEIVLGIDNLVFVAILSGRLPPAQQDHGRKVGLALALLTRLALLASLSWMVGLTKPIFVMDGYVVSWRDVILIGGGIFLLYKSTREIHSEIEADEGEPCAIRPAGFIATVVQIMVLDIVFSLDSVITAIGIATEFWVMAAAIVIAIGIMIWASASVSAFLNRHPTVKILGLSFLLLIGVTLIADGFGVHVPRGYLYAAIGFSLGVEALNQLAARRRRAARAKRLGQAPDTGSAAQS